MMPFLSATRVLDGFPPLYVTWRQETSRPFRFCGRALAVRVPFTRRALVAGIWRRGAVDEDSAYAAVGFHPTPYKEDRKVFAGEPTPRTNPFKDEAHVG